MATEPKKLYRSKTKRMIAGVCGGLSDYFSVDVSIIRLVVIIISLMPGPSIIFYLLAWVVVPEEP